MDEVWPALALGLPPAGDLPPSEAAAPLPGFTTTAVAASTSLGLGVVPEIGGAREGLLKVGPEIFDVFATDADAQQVVGHDAALGGIAVLRAANLNDATAREKAPLQRRRSFRRAVLEM